MPLKDLSNKFASLSNLQEINEEKILELREIQNQLQAEMLPELKKIYKVIAQEVMADLQTSMTARDILCFKFQCHKLKSSSGGLGFVKLQRACEMSEHFLVDRPSADAIALQFMFERINEECQRSFELLEQI